MKTIRYLTTISAFLISGTICARDTQTFGSVIEFSYDTTRANAELETFNQQIKSADLVVVDFYSPSCGPCKKLGPCITELAKEFPLVKFIKVNIKNHPKIATSYSIRSVPQIFFFKAGKNKKSFIGLQGQTTLRQVIKDLA